MHRIVISNQKGGVGKTTLTRELGVYLASLGFKVLLIDADPQGNLSKSLCQTTGSGLYEYLTGGESMIHPVKDHLEILKGDVRLALLEKQLTGEIDGYVRLKAFLDEQAGRYDYVLVDTPPSLGVLTINALTACEHLLIPLSCRLYALQGTNDLLATVSKVRVNLNAALKILGVVINAYDAVPIISRQIRQEILESFGDQVFGTALSKSIKIEEAIALQDGVIHHPSLLRSRVKEELTQIGRELIERLGTVNDDGPPE